MEVDIRKHAPVREDVRCAIAALRVQLRQIESRPQTFDEIIVALGGAADVFEKYESPEAARGALGMLLLGSIKWIADLELDPLECLDIGLAAFEYQATKNRETAQ